MGSAHAHRDRAGQHRRLHLSTVVDATGYRFDPATGNTATVSLPGGTNLRCLRLSVSANAR